MTISEDKIISYRVSHFGLSPPIYKIMKKRFFSCKKRSKLLNIQLPDIKSFAKIFQEKDELCGYCGRQLDYLGSQYPYLFSPSIDHKIPLDHGGTNTFNNLILCCHLCNIVKGTMKADSFLKLWGMVNFDLQMMKEAFRGKLASKLKRIELEG